MDWTKGNKVNTKNSTSWPLVLSYLLVVSGNGGAGIFSFLATTTANWVKLLIALLILVYASLLTQRGKQSSHQNWMLQPSAFLTFYSVIALLLLLSASILWAPIGANDYTDVLQISFQIITVMFWFTIAQKMPHLLLRTLPSILFYTGFFSLGISFLLGNFQGGRLSLFGSGPNISARILSVAAIAGLYLYQTRQKKSFYLYSTLLLLMGTVLTQSRGGLLALILAILVFLFLKNLVRLRVVSLSFVFFISIGLYFISKTPIYDDFIQIWNSRFVVLTFQDRYTSGRTYIFAKAFETWQENPIWGIGLNGFGGARLQGNYEHNFILSIAVSSGLLGITILIAVLSSALKGIGRLIRNDSWTRFLASICVFYGVASLSSGDLFDARFFWLYIVVLSCQKRVFSNKVLIREGAS
jgi:O-antigen ligase